MKIRYYKKIDGWRWLGFILAMLSAFTLSGGNPDVQWLGWSVALISCSIWIWMGVKDQDTPRALMELMYLCLLYTSPSPRDVEESRMPSSA